MTTLIDLFITALSVSYALSAVEAFIDLKKAKGFIALLLSTGILYLIGYFEYDLIIMAPAGAFSSLAIMMMLERPISVQTTRLK
jgi:hypothetical protein